MITSRHLLSGISGVLMLLGALSRGSAETTSDISGLARQSGTPEIPGLKMIWLAPWGDVTRARP